MTRIREEVYIVLQIMHFQLLLQLYKQEIDHK